MATLRDDPRTRTCVRCPSCAQEIPLTAGERRPAEFSVPCPYCGRRNLYGSADVHDSTEGMKAVKTFGTVRSATDKTIEQPTRPGSWLNACASWLQ